MSSSGGGGGGGGGEAPPLKTLFAQLRANKFIPSGFFELKAPTGRPAGRSGKMVYEPLGFTTFDELPPDYYFQVEGYNFNVDDAAFFTKYFVEALEFYTTSAPDLWQKTVKMMETQVDKFRHAVPKWENADTCLVLKGAHWVQFINGEKPDCSDISIPALMRKSSGEAGVLVPKERVEAAFALSTATNKPIIQSILAHPDTVQAKEAQRRAAKAAQRKAEDDEAKAVADRKTAEKAAKKKEHAARKDEKERLKQEAAAAIAAKEAAGAEAAAKFKASPEGKAVAAAHAKEELERRQAAKAAEELERKNAAKAAEERRAAKEAKKAAEQARYAPQNRHRRREDDEDAEGGGDAQRQRL